MTQEDHKFEYLPVKDLKLDRHNPRLPMSLRDQSEAEVIDYMLLEASTLELMQAIGENDYFAGEQLLVVEDDDRKFLVIEGNRRLTAVKLLCDPSLARVQKSKVQQIVNEARIFPISIPCLIFRNASTIHKYLGFRHITGVKSWKLLEKARYLYQLKNDDPSFQEISFKQVCRELAKMIGSRKDYVERIITGYELYKIIEDNAFYKIRGLDDTTFFFNYIADSLSRKNISAFLGIDLDAQDPINAIKPKNLEKWTHWLFEKNDQNKTRLIGDSENLNMLDKVLGNKEAKVAFDDKGLNIRRAYELTEDVDKNFKDFIANAVDNLEQADGLMHKVKDFYIGFIDDLSLIRKIALKMKQTKESLEEDEF